MKEHDKKLAGLPYDQALLEQQQAKLFEGSTKCPSDVKVVLSRVINKLKKKYANCSSPAMKEIYEKDLNCFKSIKEAATDGRKSIALTFWNSMDEESQALFHECAEMCGFPKASLYFVEEQTQEVAAPEVEENEEIEVGEHNSIYKQEFPDSAINQCLMLMHSPGYKADPELAADMFGTKVADFCEKIIKQKQQTSVKEEAETNTNIFTDEPSKDVEYEYLNSEKWALVSVKEKDIPTDEVNLPKYLIADLQAEIKDIEVKIEMFKDPGYYFENKELGMYVSQLESLHQLKKLLEEKTVVSIQRAMVYLTSLQSPIFHAMPRSVRQYLMKGYNHKSLIDYFREKK